MKEPHSIVKLWQTEIRNRALWQTRIVVLAFGILSGLAIVAFTLISEMALDFFHRSRSLGPWFTFLWVTFCTATPVWITQKWFKGAAGSGIPQVIATLQPEVDSGQRSKFVSFKLSLGKIALTSSGLLGGLSLGREGPSVQIAAGIMHAARRWLPEKSSVSPHSLLIAGGAAGIAAAFNTPLGGIMFALEELSRRPEQRNNGLVMAAIVLAGLVSVSVFGSSSYFGVIRIATVTYSLVLPGVAIALISGLIGGIFSRLLIQSVGGTSSDKFTRYRHLYPVRFSIGCGLVIAAIGIVSNGSTFGSGYLHTKALLEGGTAADPLFVLLKTVSTWLAAWTMIPGGIFAPSLAIGAGLGSNVAVMAGDGNAALIALGMVGFLAAVTQAPMTAFIIVMEMIDGYSLVLSLMSCALVANAISRLISPHLYSTLAKLQLLRLKDRTQGNPE